jgi:hypothetical protein
MIFFFFSLYLKELMFTYPKDYILSAIDMEKNLGLSDYFDLNDCFNILFCARSWAGKGVFINALFAKDIIHRTPIENIVIFSPTFPSDESFAALRNTLKINLTDE